jgi:hypothetical protein
MKHLWLSAFNLWSRTTQAKVRDFDGINISTSATATSPVSSVSEGGSITYNLEATGVDQGAIISWYLDTVEPTEQAGAEPSDFSNGIVSGTVAVEGVTASNGYTGTAIITIPISQDFTTEYAQEEVRLRFELDGNIIGYSDQVYINDTSKSPYIIVSPNVTTIQEPGTVTFSITTQSVANGATVSWSNTGTTSASDFIQNVTSGTTTIQNGTASVQLTVKDENVIEVNETIIFNVSVVGQNGVTVTDSTTVTVTNAAPSYSVSPNATQVNEGDTITWTITTTDLPNNTSLYWDLSGTASDHDFVGGDRSGTVTINNNTGSVSLTTKYNSVESNETAIFRLRQSSSATSNIVATAATVTILDSAAAVVPDKDVMNESDSVTYTITTNNVPDGTTWYWDFSIDGIQDVAASDFFEGSNGSFIINDNTGQVTLNAKFNGIESTQYIEFRIYEDSARTSLTGAHSYVEVRNSTFAVESDVTSINEGGTVTYTITTTNVTDGTIIKWLNTGSTVAADFTGAENQGTITINNNTTTLELTAKNDLLTEGAENIKLQLKPNTSEDVVLASADPVIVNDTSLTPPTYDTLTVDSIEVDEGDTVTYTLNTSHVPDGTTLYWTNSGTSTASDFFPSGDSGSFQVNNNTATISLQVYNDTSTEGSQTLILQIRTGSTAGTVVKTAPTVTINDTSLSPIWYARYDACLGTGEKLTLSHGENAWPDVIELDGICYSYTYDINYAEDGSLSTILFAGSAYDNCTTCTDEHQPASYNVTAEDSLGNTVTSLPEGDLVRFVISTQNIPDGTTLYWTNSGTTLAADFVGNVNSGSVIINNNSAYVELTLVEDTTTEGAETVIFNLRTGSTSGTVVANSPIITIDDTSVDSEPARCYTYDVINEGPFEGTYTYTTCGARSKPAALTLGPGQQGTILCTDDTYLPIDWSIIRQSPC